MRVLLCSLLIVLFSVSGIANEVHDIKFEIKNYTEDKVIIGYYYGESTLVLDTLSRVGNHFQLKGDSLLKQGVYIMLTVPDNNFIQFIVDGEDQEFKLTVDGDNLSDVSVEGSKENQLFYDYLDFLGDQRVKTDEIKQELVDAKERGKDTIAIKNKFLKIDQAVSAQQKKIVQENPNTIAAMLLSGNMQLEVPEFEGTPEEINEQKYLYIRAHYFDAFDFNHPAISRVPFFNKRIDYYLEKLTPQFPDSLIKAIDGLLLDFDANEDLRKYYLSHFLNTYAKTKIVGYDAIYVHLVDKYYAQGKAPWVKEDALGKIMKNARRLKPILIGKTAPDFTIYKEDNTPVKLAEIDTDYTLLFFWKPGCGHCEKAIPHLKEFKDADHGLDLTILTICNQTGDKYKTCWETVEEKGLEEFINLGDQYHKSRILSNYYINSTPKIFILDKDKKILIKDIGAVNLPDVFKELERRKKFLETAE